MSTIKANTIQPINAATGLVLRTNEVDRLNIDTSGNVGIGVSPSNKLHVSGTCAIVPSTNVGMRIYQDDDSANFLRFRPVSSTGSQAGFMFSGDDDSPHLTINYTSLAFGSPRIGIGTASPAVALDVNGEARSSTSTTSSSNDKTLTTKDYVDSVASANVAFLSMPYDTQYTAVTKTVTLKAGKWLAVANGHCLFTDDANSTIAISQTISCAALGYSSILYYNKSRQGGAGFGRQMPASSTTAVEITVTTQGAYTFTIGGYSSGSNSPLSRGTTLVLYYMGP